MGGMVLSLRLRMSHGPVFLEEGGLSTLPSGLSNLTSQENKMFINGGDGKGMFLLVFQHQDYPNELRAVLRHVHMKQLGNWMMANIDIGNHKIVLTGSFGNSGLPIDLTRTQDFAKEKGDAMHQPRLTADEAKELWDQMIPVPQDIADAYWKDDTGHNSVGQTAVLFRDWAIKNNKALRVRIKP
jgi:hypothetical protein